MNKIDIVVPIYKEAEVIEEFHSKLISVILNFDYRIIYCMDHRIVTRAIRNGARR